MGCYTMLKIEFDAVFIIFVNIWGRWVRFIAILFSFRETQCLNEYTLRSKMN